MGVIFSMKRILYISSIDESASAQNTARRMDVLRKLGFSVTLYTSKKRGISELLRMIPHIHTYDALYIRVDGACRLEKFSLLKLLRPSLRVFWEIHGFPEENDGKETNGHAHRQQTVKRRVYSLCADGYIFVSEELQRYAKGKIACRPQAVIPNFIRAASRQSRTHPQFPHLKTKGTLLHYVLWTGNGAYPWHALDTIERVAKLSYLHNKHIRFIIISPSLWHTFLWHKNVVFLAGAPNDVTNRYIQQSDICLALYHKPPACPFYFSQLKILDYMTNKKPVIATGAGQITTLITNGVNGYTTTNEPDDVVKKILYLIAHPKEKHAIGNRGYNTVVRERSYSKAKKEYRAFFSNVWQ
jgi:glycosyltransferase involved in cell wall biosynthesis